MSGCIEALPVTGEMLFDTFTCQRLTVQHKPVCCSIEAGGRVHACGMSIFFTVLIPVLPFIECNTILSDSNVHWINCSYKALDCACILLTPLSLVVRAAQACGGVIYPPCLFESSIAKVAPVIPIQEPIQVGDLKQSASRVVKIDSEQTMVR